MRTLTAKQKKLLTKWLEENAKTINAEIRSVDELTGDQWETLETINDTEILWQETNRFISDWRWSKI